MEGFSAMAGEHKPVRSISLPSRLHSNSHKIEEVLNKLKTSEFSSSSASATSTPLGAKTIQMGLVGLAELYNCVEELLHFPLTQQALHNHHGKQVEEALDGSVGLLDAYGAARDMFLTMKEHAQDLQSVLRRRGGDSSIESEIHAYICCRKKMTKEIVKSHRALKRLESNNNASFLQLYVDDQYLSMVIKLLRELSTIAISIFRSLMLFLSVPAMKTKAGGWSLIAKLVPIASERRLEKFFNEVGNVDHDLYFLHGKIRKNDNAKVDVQLVQRRLETLNDGINNLEGGLDGLYRCLIQHRVSLLNILTP